MVRTGLCDLSASGATNTPERVLDWADRAVSEARKALNGVAAFANVWPYSHGGTEFLGCSIRGNSGSISGYAVTFVIDLDADLTFACEPHVPTMGDALHMVGIVLAALDANIAVGRRGQEVNQRILREPLASGRTNGPMRSAGSNIRRR